MVHGPNIRQKRGKNLMSTQLSKLSKEQLIAMLEQQSKNSSNELIVKFNSAGGVFIRHASLS